MIFRKVLQTPFLSFINILCLSIGMFTILFISIWISDELSFDKFHPQYQNIYRFSVKVDDVEAGYHTHFARSYFSWIFQIKEKTSGIKEMARLNILKNHIVMTPEKEAFRTDIILSDPSVFDVFWFRFLKGSAADAFSKPMSMVLTESAARKYFGGMDPVGKVLEVYCDRCTERKMYTITGIIADYPPNSHFHFDMIGNIENPENFSGWAYYYVLLDENTSPGSVIENFPSFAAGFTTEDYVKNLTPDLQPIHEIHLNSFKDREIEENGHIRYIWLFSGLSLFVLFVALFNFINVRQVNLIRNRKTLSILRIHGASKSELFFLQVTESFILSIVALFAAVVMVMVFLPGFNQLSGKSVEITQIWSSTEWWLVITALLVLAVFAGIYPFLINDLKSGLRRNNFLNPPSVGKKFRLTRIYVALQFAASLILLITVLIVNRQVDFFMENRLGSSTEKILCIENMPVQVMNNYQIFKSELLKNPLIHDVTSSFESPADENMDMMGFETINVSDEVKNKLLFVYPADDNFFRFYDIQFISGSDFSPFFGNDSLSENYILNRKACEFLGWKPEDAVDKPFRLQFMMKDKNLFNGGRVVGVVEDFQMSSMKKEIKPYVFFQKSFWMMSAQIKFDTKQTSEAFNVIESAYEKAFPGFPMQYSYVEDLYTQIYRNENQLKSLSMLLGILAMLLSSLGLWGITGIIYQSKTKEIGIRKVNGARKEQVIILLLKDIHLIVFFALLTGLPAAYILINNWLTDFPLRISLEWWMFAIPAMVVYLTAILTVFWQADTAAGMNPVESLRYE